MAETLGTLVDKLAIADLKLWHCQELLMEGPGAGPDERRARLEEKNHSLLHQRCSLIQEIDALFAGAKGGGDRFSRLVRRSTGVWGRGGDLNCLASGRAGVPQAGYRLSDHRVEPRRHVVPVTMARHEPVSVVGGTSVPATRGS